MKTEAECRELAHELADVFKRARCAPVDVIRVTAGFMISCVMAHAASREDALDGCDALIADMRRTILKQYDDIAALRN